MLGALVCTGLCAAPAQAHQVLGRVRDISGRGAVAQARAAAGPSNLPYDGGPVLHRNRTHVIFWQPSGSGLTFDAGYQAQIETFLQNVAADSRRSTNVYGLTGQYTDGAGPAAYDSTYGGAVTATDSLPANGCIEPPVTGPGWTVCLTDKQLQAEIERVVRADRLPTTNIDVYFLVMPNGMGSCTDATSTSCALGGSVNGYCGYHSQTSDGEVLYAIIPYNAVPGHCQSDNPRPNASTADPTISTISHEHNEMITDPIGDAWVDSSGNEDGDLCITTFGPSIGGSGQSAWNEDIDGGHYFIQEEWSNEDSGCEPRDEPDRAWFWAPGRVTSTKSVRVVGRGHDPDGSIVSYLWSWGDGANTHRRASRHTFRRPGTYVVTLRITDSAGNWTFYTRTVRVSARRRARAGDAPARANSGGAIAR